MVGPIKFSASDDKEAVKKAKKIMISKGWRNLNLIKFYKDGWGFCCCIPSFEKK